MILAALPPNMLSARWHIGRFMIMLLFAAIVFACLFSMMLPPSASLLAPTPTLSPTVTPTPSLTPIPTITLTSLPSTSFPGYTVYFERDLWETVVGAPTGVEDFEQDLFDYAELPFPYITGNGFALHGTTTAQILIAPELLDSGNLIHFRDFEQGLTITFPNNAVVTAFGFNYTSSEDWLLTFNEFQTPLPVGQNKFVGVLMQQYTAAQFTLSGPPRVQRGLSVDNIAYVVPSIFVPSTSTATPEAGTP